jgi:hypothetical protein
MKRTLFSGALAMLAAAGCGGGGAAGPTGTTYTLASAAGVDVTAGGCALAWGPEDVQSGTMFYDIADDPPGTDVIEAVIIPDSFYLQYGCGFDANTQALVDDNAQGSRQGQGPMVADSYDFVVLCHNPTTDCQFTLTWTATY